MDYEKDDFAVEDPRQEIIERLTRDMTSNKRRLNEIKDQIDSMQSSVDKEQAKYSGIAIELRNIQDNLDTVPREDIRDKYDEALQVRFRLATMRGQLEKFEANYELLQQHQVLLNETLGKLQGITIADGDEGFGPVSNSGGFDIIGIIRAQEEERQRMARAMHDGPAQSLTNFILQAEICQRLFDRNPDKAAEELVNLKQNASKTFQKVRDFIFDLRPMMLDDLGVAPTVRRYVESYHEKHDIEAKLEIAGDDRRLENYREVLIFRSIQDVMSMARDYGSPTEIALRVDLSGDPIRIHYEDDGRSFDANSVFTSDQDDVSQDARVQALRMLKGKLELVGGTLSATSGDDGTQIRMEIPTGD